MGHGSYLQGLETTATFDRLTDEFVLNTPTVTATKWWIGMAGQTATHAAVFARLIVDGVEHGLQTFICPLRSLQTGEPVPNISVGDMGSKMGRNGLDNGWIQFHQKRVPRDAMLQRWAKLDRDGKFTPPPSKQIAYNALVRTRVELSGACSHTLKKALTIVVRYALVRKQFLHKDDPQGARGEQKLLDYPTHQARLFPIMAHAFALHFTANSMQRTCDASFADLEANISGMPQLHATSAGLKALGTWYTNDALETCRQSLGGMGYSSYSALPAMRADWAGPRRKEPTHTRAPCACTEETACIATDWPSLTSDILCIVLPFFPCIWCSDVLVGGRQHGVDATDGEVSHEECRRHRQGREGRRRHLVPRHREGLRPRAGRDVRLRLPRCGLPAARIPAPIGAQDPRGRASHRGGGDCHRRELRRRRGAILGRMRADRARTRVHIYDGVLPRRGEGRAGGPQAGHQAVSR
jgi:hypothetical protein